MAKIKKVIKPKVEKACEPSGIDKGIEEARTSYEAREKEKRDALADKPPRVDGELIEHILDIWGKFYDKVTGPIETPVDINTTEDDRHNQRIAAYLTMTYFLSGGKLPPEKFYSIALIDELLKDK
jgi:hypothetical protein